MSREEIHKLLGGYATGTLTPGEQQALFDAALGDQELFDALAREQSLRDLLQDPAARAHLLASLGERPLSRAERIQRWIWGRAVGLAAVACLLGVVGYVGWQSRYSEKPRVVVEMKQPTTIEVRGDASPQPAPQAMATARRVFNPESARRAAPAPPRELPAPPSVRQMARVTPPEQFLGTISGFAVPSPPVETVPSAPPARAVAPLAIPAANSFRAEARAVGGVGRGMTEQVTVTASAAAISRQDAALGARALYYSFAVDGANVSGFLPQQALTAPAPSPHLGLRYQILRKRPDGAFEPLPSGQTLAPGDTVKMRFVPNDAGLLSVQEPGRTPQVLLTTAVQQFGSAETDEVSLASAGTREFLVTFRRQGTANGAAGAVNGIRSEADAGERTTYVVNAGADPKSPVSFTITLTSRDR